MKSGRRVLGHPPHASRGGIRGTGHTSATRAPPPVRRGPPTVIAGPAPSMATADLVRQKLDSDRYARRRPVLREDQRPPKVTVAAPQWPPSLAFRRSASRESARRC